MAYFTLLIDDGEGTKQKIPFSESLLENILYSAKERMEQDPKLLRDKNEAYMLVDYLIKRINVDKD